MPVPGEDPIRPELVKVMNDIARVLDGAINEAGCAKKFGFALMVFDFDGGGYMNYVSNAERKSMLKAMQEFIDRNNVARDRIN